MQVTSDQIDPCTLVLDIVVDDERVSKAFELTLREFNRNTSVPGFRPGKAPRAILERYVQMDKVNQRTMEKLVTACLTEIIAENEYEPIRSPMVKPTELKDHTEFSFQATLPFAPQVTLGEYTGITVEKPIFKVDETIIDRRIEQLLNERARLVKVTDRPVGEGDVLITEMSETVEGAEAVPAKRRLIQLGNNIPGLDEGVIGMNIDEEKTLDLVYPEDYNEEALRGKKVTFHIKLISISGKQKPEMNDAFAKEVAGVESVSELRDSLRTSLDEEAINLSNQMAEQNILTEIVKNAELYYPAVLVQEEMEEDYKRLGAELRRYKMTYEAFLESNNITQEQHQASVAQQAEDRLRVVLALRDIARLENLEVDDPAIDAEFDRMAESGQIAPEQLEDFRGQARRRFQIANALVQVKLHDFLFSKNTFNEVTAPNSAEEALVAAEA